MSFYNPYQPMPQQPQYAMMPQQQQPSNTARNAAIVAIVIFFGLLIGGSLAFYYLYWLPKQLKDENLKKVKDAIKTNAWLDGLVLEAPSAITFAAPAADGSVTVTVKGKPEQYSVTTFKEAGGVKLITKDTVEYTVSMVGNDLAIKLKRKTVPAGTTPPAPASSTTAASAAIVAAEKDAKSGYTDAANALFANYTLAQALPLILVFDKATGFDMTDRKIVGDTVEITKARFSTPFPSSLASVEGASLQTALSAEGIVLKAPSGYKITKVKDITPQLPTALPVPMLYAASFVISK